MDSFAFFLSRPSVKVVPYSGIHPTLPTAKRAADGKNPAFLTTTFSFLNWAGQWEKEKKREERETIYSKDALWFYTWATSPCRISFPLQKGMFLFFYNPR